MIIILNSNEIRPSDRLLIRAETGRYKLTHQDIIN